MDLTFFIHALIIIGILRLVLLLDVAPLGLDLLFSWVDLDDDGLGFFFLLLGLERLNLLVDEGRSVLELFKLHLLLLLLGDEDVPASSPLLLLATEVWQAVKETVVVGHLELWLLGILLPELRRCGSVVLGEVPVVLVQGGQDLDEPVLVDHGVVLESKLGSWSRKLRNVVGDGLEQEAFLWRIWARLEPDFLIPRDPERPLSDSQQVLGIPAGRAVLITYEMSVSLGGLVELADSSYLRFGFDVGNLFLH